RLSFPPEKPITVARTGSVLRLDFISETTISTPTAIRTIPARRKMISIRYTAFWRKVIRTAHFFARTIDASDELTSRQFLIYVSRKHSPPSTLLGAMTFQRVVIFVLIMQLFLVAGLFAAGQPGGTVRGTVTIGNKEIPIHAIPVLLVQ